MEAELQLDLPIPVAAPLVILCLALGAYMSAAETAITGTSRPRMHRLAQQGNKRAAIVNGLRVVGKDIAKVKLVCSGAGAAALACLDMLVALGMKMENIWEIGRAHV